MLRRLAVLAVAALSFTGSAAAATTVAAATFVFNGHGYKGTVDSLAQFPGASVAGIGDNNVTTIVFAATK